MFVDEDVVSNKRKRVLISNDFKNAFKRKNIYDVFQEIDQASWRLKSTAKRLQPDPLAVILSRYEICYKPKPKYAKDKSKRLTYKKNKYKYSLFNPQNVHIVGQKTIS